VISGDAMEKGRTQKEEPKKRRSQGGLEIGIRGKKAGMLAVGMLAVVAAVCIASNPNSITTEE